MVMFISDDVTKDLPGPAKRDVGIRIHIIHKFTVAHAWCSVGFCRFVGLFGCAHFVVFIDFVDLLVYGCDSIFMFYLHILCLIWVFW